MDANGIPGPLMATAPSLTVRTRLSAAGLAPDRIAEHHAAGRIRVDGRRVADLDEPAPPPARVVVWHE